MSDQLPKGLDARLRIIAASAPYGGLSVGAFISRGDQELISRGLVEVQGQRIMVTEAGRELVESRDGRAA